MDNQKPGQPKPGHTTVESLDLPLALRRCPCADHRQRSRRRSPSAAGACRCATSDPGCPHPRLQPALGTKHKALQHHCLSIDGKGGWDRQKSNTSVVKATMRNQICFSPDPERKCSQRKLVKEKKLEKGFSTENQFSAIVHSRLAGGRRRVLSPVRRTSVRQPYLQPRRRPVMDPDWQLAS